MKKIPEMKARAELLGMAKESSMTPLGHHLFDPEYDLKRMVNNVI